MDVYITFMQLAVTPEAIATILGSLVGAFINSDTKRYGLKLTFLMTILTCAAAGAIGDYVKLQSGNISIFAYIILGGFTGIFGLSLLDAMRISMPGFTTKLVNGITETLIVSIIELIKLFFTTIKEYIKLFKLQRMNDNDEDNENDNE